MRPERRPEIVARRLARCAATDGVARRLATGEAIGGVARRPATGEATGEVIGEAIRRLPFAAIRAGRVGRVWQAEHVSRERRRMHGGACRVRVALGHRLRGNAPQ